MDRLEFLESLAMEYDHGQTSLTPATTFAELGMDSYAVVDFAIQVEEHYDIAIPDDEMLNLKTIQDVLDAIDRYHTGGDQKC